MNVTFVNTAKEWDQILATFAPHDFFHSYIYHAERARCMDAQPTLVCVLDGDLPVFCFPLLRRTIDENFFDLVSVYGYSGPLCRDISQFESLLNLAIAELRKQGCVSLFSRLHPLIHEDYPDVVGTQKCGRTVLLNCLPEEERLNSFRKTTRYEIRRLAKTAEVRFTGLDSLDVFLDIYQETMLGLEADDFYFFDHSFVQSIFEIEDTEATIGLVYNEGIPISAAIFTTCCGIGQYFLGGARREHSRLAPQKLLLHRACEWMLERNVTQFHLGGGRGASEDGLFKFKASFSKQFMDFKVMKLIVNPDKYSELTRSKHPQSSVSEFFPAYRTPVSA